MTWLELKIPPLLILGMFIVFTWIASLLTTTWELSVLWKTLLVSFFVILGTVVSVAGVLAFRNAKTTVNPLTPEASTALVTSGIYRYTRNPMYLGFLCVLIAWGIYVSSPAAIFVVVGFIAYMNEFQIKPEERILKDRFTTDYQHYSSKVRRWL